MWIDIAASDVIEDASGSLLGYPSSCFVAGFTEEGDQLLLLASQQYENEAIQCYGRVTRDIRF